MWITTGPREVAAAVLAEAFGDETGGEAGPDSIFELPSFQADGARRCVEILRRRRGVLIADSVGMGKTYIALALAERWLREGGRVAVITPAAIGGTWRALLRRLAASVPGTSAYGLTRAGSWSTATGPVPVPPAEASADGPARGGLRGVVSPAAAPSPAGAPILAWLSHARLARGTFPREFVGGLELVIVDEAHAFRNPATRRHRALASLCRGARVALVTATPINNSLADLYWLLRLFAGDGAFADIGVADLTVLLKRPGARRRGGGRPATGAERDPATGAEQEADRVVARVLEEVMVRRTRSLLPGADGRTPPPWFPHRAPPAAVRYSLDTLRPGLLTELIEAVDSLTFAPLRPSAYGGAVDQRQDRPTGRAAETAPDLVRLAMLKRLESSLAAFRISVARQARFVEAFLDALARGRLLAPRDHHALHGAGGGRHGSTASGPGTAPDDGDVIQLVLAEVALDPLPATLDRSRLEADAARDLELLRQVLATLRSFPATADPKLRRLIALLDDELRGRKVVVFTEFRDTARHLWHALHRRGRVGLVDGEGARLGAGRAGRREVVERFAPRANLARPPRPHERVDLLIATDVLAEGLNLQDAADVVCYDLPWNPVRLIQRIGRVDRLGSDHDVVRSHHFLPDDGLEHLLGVVGALRRKLAAIGVAVGLEAPVLDPREDGGEDRVVATVVERITVRDPELSDALPDALERLRAAWTRRLRLHGPRKELDASGGGVPVAVLAAAPDDPLAGRTFVACRVNGRRMWVVGDGTGLREDDAAAARILLRALEGGEGPPTAPVPAALDTTALEKTLRALEPLIAERLRAAVRYGPPIGAGSAAALAARRLRRALARVPGGPDAALCARADAVFHALRQPVDAGTEAAIREAMREGDAEGMIDALERVIGGAGEGARVDGGEGSGVGAGSAVLGIIQLSGTA